MTMVSRYKLRPDVWEKIFNLFTQSVVNIKDKASFEVFISDFLSPTEKIMLAKRFAAAVLLAKGNGYEDIKRVLHLSSATVAKINVGIKYNEKGINEVIHKVLKKDAARLVWEEIQSILDHPTKGLPISMYHKQVQKRQDKIFQLEKGIV